jgi:hypothetical protein
MYLIAFPLLIIPFAIFNMILFLLHMPFTDTVFTIPLGPDRELPLSIGDLLIIYSMLLFYIEVLKGARFGSKGVIDHILSLVLFLAITAELVLVPEAEGSTLLLLSTLSFIDVITGLSLTVGRREERTPHKKIEAIA